MVEFTHGAVALIEEGIGVEEGIAGPYIQSGSAQALMMHRNA